MSQHRPTMSARIQLADLARQNLPLWPKIEASVRSIVERSAFILGPEVQEFEKAYATWIGVKEAVGCANGTDAIYLALAALDIGPGDEVVTTTFTFSATVSAIQRAGARPVLIDVEGETYTMDPRQLERAITPKTRAIVPVHLFGQMADMDAVMSIANRRRLAVIEDCAQAHGATWKKRKAGTFGVINTFSFFPSKNLSAMGDAGLCTTNDPKLAHRLKCLRVHGRADKHESLELGANSRLDTIQAAILNIKLPYLDEWNQWRRRAADWYLQALAGGDFGLPRVGEDREHVWHQFTILTDRRETVTAALSKAGIGHGIHYPMPVHLMRGFASLGYGKGAFPMAERLTSRILSLPMFPGITENEVAEVARVLKTT